MEFKTYDEHLYRDHLHNVYHHSYEELWAYFLNGINKKTLFLLFAEREEIVGSHVGELLRNLAYLCYCKYKHDIPIKTTDNTITYNRHTLYYDVRYLTP